LFLQQSSGLSTRQLILEHASRESIAVTTAWRDWERVNDWLQKDWEKDKAQMLARLNNMRLRAINMALKKSQLSSAQALLSDLGRSIGEGTEFTTAEEVKLNISIEPQADK
jgi:hypothetical protein